MFASQAWPADWSTDAVLGDPTHHAVICFCSHAWPADQYCYWDTYFLTKLTCWRVCSCRSCPSHCDVFVSQAWPADRSVGAVPGDCTHQAVIFSPARHDLLNGVFTAVTVDPTCHALTVFFFFFFCQAWRADWFVGTLPGDLTHYAMMYFSAKCDRFLEILPIMLLCICKARVTCRSVVLHGPHHAMMRLYRQLWPDDLVCWSESWWAYSSSCNLFSSQAWPADWSVDLNPGERTHQAAICFPAKRDLLIGLLVLFLVILPLVALAFLAYINRQRLLSWWQLGPRIKFGWVVWSLGEWSGVLWVVWSLGEWSGVLWVVWSLGEWSGVLWVVWSLGEWSGVLWVVWSLGEWSGVLWVVWSLGEWSGVLWVVWSLGEWSGVLWVVWSLGEWSGVLWVVWSLGE